MKKRNEALDILRIFSLLCINGAQKDSVPVWEKRKTGELKGSPVND